MVAAVNRLDADVVAITGDLVDGSVAELAEHVAPLAALRSREGSYFVTGNHEYYSGAAAWVNELRRLGVAVLMNQHVVLRRGDAQLVLAGVTDYSAGQFDRGQASDPKRALAGSPPEAAVRVLLAHQPRSAAGGGRRRLRPAALRPCPRRPVPALELPGPPAAAIHRWPAPLEADVGLHQPRHRLLGPAEALRGAFGDHALALGRGPCRGRAPLRPPATTGRTRRQRPALTADLQFAGFAGAVPGAAAERKTVFISEAYAQAAPAATGSADSVLGGLGGMLPLVLMFVVLYFIMIRPQMKKQKEHRAMVEALGKGDEVVTSGGLLGKVSKMGETFLGIEVANGVEIQVQRSAVVQVMPKGTLKRPEAKE